MTLFNHVPPIESPTADCWGGKCACGTSRSVAKHARPTRLPLPANPVARGVARAAIVTGHSPAMIGGSLGAGTNMLQISAGWTAFPTNGKGGILVGTVGPIEDPASAKKADKKCGPNITKFFVDNLYEAMKEIDISEEVGRREFGEGASSFRAGMYFASLIRLKSHLGGGGTFDFKPDNRVLDGCPVECPNTVTLCGLCLDDDVPGNFAFGFLAEYVGKGTKWALDYSEDLAQADHKRDPVNNPNPHDSPDDVASITDGGELGGDMRKHPPKNKDEFKDRVCASIKKLAKDKSMTVHACPLCDKEYKGHPKTV